MSETDVKKEPEKNKQVCCQCGFYKQPLCFINKEDVKFTARKKTCVKWKARS